MKTKASALTRGTLLAASLALLAAILTACLPLTGTGVTRAASSQREGVADWTILGLDTRDYQNVMCNRVSLSDRQWVRHHKVLIRWEMVHKAKDSYDFGYYDQEISRILADGSQSILLLLHGPTPAWARDPAYGNFAGNAPPKDLGDWYDFCSEVAERYGSVADFYEIWNEPGWDRDAEAYTLFGTYHFGGQVESDYLPMLQLAHAAIKEKDPGGLVMCGAMINTLNQNANTGADLYLMLYDEVNRPGQDISLEVTADKPIVAERPMYFDYQRKWTGGHDVVGATAPAREWYFAEGTTRDGFEEWLCLQNPNQNHIEVTATYMFGPGQGENQTQVYNLGPTSRTTFNVNGLVGEGKDVSVKLTSASDFIAERPMYFSFGGGWTGGHDVLGAKEASDKWYFAEGCTGFSIQQYVCLQNPQAVEVPVELKFMMTKGEVLHRNVVLPPNSRTTLDVNMLIGFHGCSDLIASHPYKDYWNWGKHYAYLSQTLRAHNIWQEIAVTEIGWPHYTDNLPNIYSEAKQAEAIGKQGVGGLFSAGCKKIWIYRDIDEDPGTSWDRNYFGLFDYQGRPHPSWYIYVQWQQQLPNYPELPSTLP